MLFLSGFSDSTLALKLRTLALADKLLCRLGRGAQGAADRIVAALGDFVLLHAGNLTGPMAKTSRPQKPPITLLKDGENITPTTGLKHEKLLGRFVSTWSRFESSMELLIWELFGLDMAYGRIITTRLDASSRIQMLKLLGKQVFSGVNLLKFEKYLNEIDQIRDDRNFIIHATWFTRHPGQIPMAFSMRPKSDPTHVVGETFPNKRMTVLISSSLHLTQVMNAYREIIVQERAKSQAQSPESSPNPQPNPEDQIPEEPFR